MSENKHDQQMVKYQALRHRLDDFKRIRADPSLGLSQEMPLLADLVELLAEFTILNVEIEARKQS